MKISASCAALVLTLLASCSTSTETDAGKLSTWQMLTQKDRLDQHLESRRQYLRALNNKLAAMDDELLESKAKLFTTRKELEAAKQPGEELAALLTEIRRLERESETLTDRVLKAKQNVADLEKRVAEQKAANEELDRLAAEAKAHVDNLEKQLAVVKAGIARAIKLRAEQLLREN